METIQPKKARGLPIGPCKVCRNLKPIKKDGICIGCARGHKTKKRKVASFQVMDELNSKRHYARKAVVAAARVWRNDRSETSILQLVDAVDRLEDLYKKETK